MEVTVQENKEWLCNSAVVTCKVQSDVLLMKSILNDTNVRFDSVSLLGDNRVLVTFATKQLLDDFVTSKDSFSEFFNSVEYWSTSQVQSVKRFVWINVIGIPLQFWNLDFFKVIGAACGKFISLAEPTISRRRLDVASLLISTFMSSVPSILTFKVNGLVVKLHVVESATDVEMADDDVDDDRSEKSDSSEEMPA